MLSRYFEPEFLSLSLSPIQKLIYIYLTSISDETGFVSVSTKEISIRIGCSRVSVSNALSVLSDRSLVRIYPALSIGDLNSYKILNPFVSNDLVEDEYFEVEEPEPSYDEKIEKAMRAAREAVKEMRITRSNGTSSPFSSSSFSPKSSSSESKRAKARSNRKKKKKR